MANTTSPTCNASESANSSTGNCSCPSLMRSTARSVRGSFKTSVASNSRLSARETLTPSAPSITRLLGTTSAAHSSASALVTGAPDQATCIDDHARAQRALQLIGSATTPRAAEEAAENRVIQKRDLVLAHFGGVNIDDRGCHMVDDRGIRQTQLGLRRKPSLLGSGGGRQRGENQDNSQGLHGHRFESRRMPEI